MATVNDAQFIEKYLGHCKRQNKTQKTIENYKSAINIFNQFLQSKHANFLTVDGMENKDLLEEFLDYLMNDRKVTYARVKIYFSALSNLYAWLEYNGHIKKNIVLTVRKMYVREYKNGYVPATRKTIPVEEMSKFLNSIMDVKTKAICLLLIKTGIRRNELVNIDVDDIDWKQRSIMLKSIFHKRSNPLVFFDEETEGILQQWLNRRKYLVDKDEKALFVSDFGKRLKRSGITNAVTKWTSFLDYHDAKSKKLEDHFTPHNFRHCFTDYLRQAGCPREIIKELRGDKQREPIDIYTHISDSELRRSYLAYMPKFNVY